MSDGPYKLPDGWRWVRLGEVCEINPRRPRIVRDPEAPTTFIPMSAVDEEDGTIVAAEEKPFALVRQGYTYFEEGDVLFAKITPCMENGKAAIARGLRDGIGFGSTEFHVLRPRGSVISEWIWLFVRREPFREAARRAFRGGVGQQRVPQDFLEEHPLPLPPLPEQRRIVARIEELMGRVREARRLREEAKRDAERLWQAVLAETFPRPGAELPEGWRWVRLGEVCEIYYGKRITKRQAEEGNYPVYGGGGVTFYHAQYNRENDIVVSRFGMSEECVRFVEGKFFLNDSGFTIILRDNPTSEGKKWLYFALKTIEKEVYNCGRGQAQKNIDVDCFKNLIIPLPPLHEQQIIARIISQVDQVIEKEKNYKQKLERIKKGLMEDLLTGKVRVKISEVKEV